jgi:hypothetical protein
MKDEDARGGAMAEANGASAKLWFPTRIWSLVKRAASIQTRTLAGQVRHYVIEGLRRDGFLLGGEEG